VWIFIEKNIFGKYGILKEHFCGSKFAVDLSLKKVVGNGSFAEK